MYTALNGISYLWREKVYHGRKHNRKRQEGTMQAQDIERYLADLGQQLQHMGIGQPVRILMIGRAFMLTQFHNRPATNEVEVLLKEVDNPATSPLYQTFKVAVRTVAIRHQLPLSWMNDVMEDFLRDSSVIPPGCLWRTYGPLEVYIPPAAYILALKLLAGCLEDRADIEILCQQVGIRTRTQAQQVVNRYIPNRHIHQLHDLDQTLTMLFP
jgi:hypothetical protein